MKCECGGDLYVKDTRQYASFVKRKKTCHVCGKTIITIEKEINDRCDEAIKLLKLENSKLKIIIKNLLED